jgi:predicted GH43/DUF377 family glycosyl hydrolase
MSRSLTAERFYIRQGPLRGTKLTDRLGRMKKFVQPQRHKLTGQVGASITRTRRCNQVNFPTNVPVGYRTILHITYSSLINFKYLGNFSLSESSVHATSPKMITKSRDILHCTVPKKCNDPGIVLHYPLRLISNTHPKLLPIRFVITTTYWPINGSAIAYAN